MIAAIYARKSWVSSFARRFASVPCVSTSRGAASAPLGVPRARVGVDARGKPYAAGGRGGIHMRERIRGHGGRWRVVLVGVAVIVAWAVWREVIHREAA